MEPTPTTFDLHKLVDALVDGKASDEAINELSRRLHTDSAVRRAYIEYMCIEAELSSTFLVPTPIESTTAEVTSVRAGIQETFTKRWTRRRLTQWLGIGASLLLAVSSSSWVTYLCMRDRQLSAATAGDKDPAASEAPIGEPVARISGTQNCRWRKIRNEPAVGYGDLLYAFQRLELEEGLAEISFSNGVRIVLEGPATFQAPGEGQVNLLSGRMAAAVPHSATGFTVRAPRVTINDTGTQFGVVADQDDGTEVHVFKGPIHARAIDDGGQELGSVQLVANEAARLSPTAIDFALFRANQNEFVRTLAPPTGPIAGLLAFEDFSYPVGPLAWQNGGFGWAGPWTDIETAGGTAGVHGAPTNGVADGSLAGSEIISRGNRAEQTGQFNRIRRALSTSFCGVFDAAGLIENQDALRLIGHDNRTVYISFLQRTSQTNDEFYGLELHRGDGNANRVLCIGNGGTPGAAKYSVSSTFNMPQAKVAEDYVLPLGEEDANVHFFVVRIEFGVDDYDTVTVYRDPTSLTDERQCVVTAKLRGNYAFDRISLGNFNGTKRHEVDEIRVGTDFVAVTGQVDLAPDLLAESAAPIENPYVMAPTTLSLHSPLIRRESARETLLAAHVFGSH